MVTTAAKTDDRALEPARKFLTAEWRHLAMLNYEIDGALLESRAPRGTELDRWQGRTFVSVVGFQFLRTRLFGIAIPFHQNFVEINLRFYVRRRAQEGWRRGVVFIKEIVPRWAVATVARVVYNESYVTRRMRQRVDLAAQGLNPNDSIANGVEYGWREAGRWHELRVETTGELRALAAGSEEEFIAEHYWGYTAQRDGGALEYQVEHPPWRVWPASGARFDCDVARVYGRRFADCLSARPTSAFVADGSPVVVRRGRRVS
ncbi:MAG: YqjF family protein [Planctomycetota bacterium]